MKDDFREIDSKAEELYRRYSSKHGKSNPIHRLTAITFPYRFDPSIDHNRPFNPVDWDYEYHYLMPLTFAIPLAERVSKGRDEDDILSGLDNKLREENMISRIRNAVSDSLTEPQYKVLSLYAGLEGEEFPLEADEIAQRLGVSRNSIMRLIDDATGELRANQTFKEVLKDVWDYAVDEHIED